MRDSTSGVQVQVTTDGKQVCLLVADDGVGGADAGRGTGLRGIADRVDALGGHLAVESPVAGGTRVTVTLPLRAEARRAASAVP